MGWTQKWTSGWSQTGYNGKAYAAYTNETSNKQKITSMTGYFAVGKSGSPYTTGNVANGTNVYGNGKSLDVTMYSGDSTATVTITTIAGSIWHESQQYYYQDYSATEAYTWTFDTPIEVAAGATITIYMTVAATNIIINGYRKQTATGTAVSSYTLTLTKGTGVASFTGAGEYPAGSSVTTKATASTGYLLSQYSGTTSDGSGTSTWTGCNGLSSHSTTWTMNADRSLTVSASLISYTITYNLNGGTLNSSTSNQTQTYYITSSLTLKGTPTRDGYTFGGWKVTTAAGNWTSGTTYTASKSMSTGNYGNITLTAQWTAVSYTITYNLNGGSISGSTANQQKTYDVATSLTLLAAPDTAPTGYQFSSWKVTTAAGSWTSGTTYAASKSVSTGNYGDVTLTAQWSLQTYTITYKPNGGTMSSTSQTYNITTSLSLKAAPAITGYDFSKWKVTTARGNWTSSTTYAASASIGTGKYGNTTLTAQWIAWPYTIQYNANLAGVSTATATSSHSYGDGSYLTASPFSISGYTLLGWATSASGSVVYSTGTVAPYQLVTSSGQTVQLYAVWSQNSPWRLANAKVYSGSKWYTC